MATVDEALARTVIANKGRYADDPPVLQVMTYTDPVGEKVWALLYEQDVLADWYRSTPYVRAPGVVWAAPIEVDGHKLVDSTGRTVKYGDVGGPGPGLRVVGGRPAQNLVWAVPIDWDAAERGTYINLIDVSKMCLKWESIE